MKDERRSDQKSRRGGLAELLGSGSSGVRRKLVAVGLVVVLALAGSASALAWRQYQDGKQRALHDLQSRAVLAATVFDVYFAGQIATLKSIAASPSVQSMNEPAMHAYFLRIESSKPKPFTEGLGWIDSRGFSRVSTRRTSAKHLNVSDRLYFRQALRGGEPYISAGLRARLTHQLIIVMSVPTRDAGGRTTGVLAGALRLQRSRTNRRAIDLGYEGLAVIDRAGQELTRTSFARPANAALLRTLRRGEGVLGNTRGLDDSSGRVVAYANSAAPHWTTVIDRPRSAVFAAARRALEIELASIGAATLMLLGIIAWAIVRSGKAASEIRADAERWDELTQSLGDVVLPTEVSNVLAATLESSFPECAVVVSLASGRRAGSSPSGLARSNEELAFALTELVPRGEVVVLADRDAVRQRLRELGFGSALAEAGSLLVAPLHSPEGEPAGAVMVVSSAERVFDERARALLATHVEEAGRALARTSRYQHEHDVAVTLQQSLLPPGLPEVEGMRFAARYEAGGAGLAVGGDWYDVLHRPDGIVHLTVGDVAGRGIDAAATMARLRHAFRAYAFEYGSPAQIVGRLGRHVPTGSMATVVCIAFDPYAGRLAYASAGHPPPLLVDGDEGRVRRLDVVTTTPLGWTTNEPPVDTHLRLSPGAVLAAYTDGLVERRGTMIDAGIARISSVLERSARLGVARIVRELLSEAADGARPEDDVAVLVSLFVGHPSTMSIELPARMDLLASLRRRLRSWLAARGLEEPERADTVLAISEAFNNAIEHAYADEPGTIRLAVEHSSERLVITVQDDGAWRERPPDPSRGRGMLIMRGLMDTVDVEVGPDGTCVVMQLERGRDREVPFTRETAPDASPVA